jgi:hypothetical protein
MKIRIKLEIGKFVNFELELASGPDEKKKIEHNEDKKDESKKDSATKHPGGIQ